MCKSKIKEFINEMLKDEEALKKNSFRKKYGYQVLVVKQKDTTQLLKQNNIYL